jgi:DivIVA domain-containing protein
MTGLKTRSHEFATGLRGYDRAQVDEYIDHLRSLLTDAEARAHDAEAEYVFDEHAAVGPRIAEIFALAEAEAREITATARRSAGELRERVEREHVVMFAELEQERERIRGEVAVLERRKAEAIGELHRLREVLGEAAGVTGSVVEVNGRGRAPAVLTSGSDQTVELPAVTVDLDET